MQYIWSPWRMTYIQNNTQTGCPLCQELAVPDGPGNLIVHRGQRAFVILNRYPYTSGHVMTVPYAHLPSLEDLDPATRAELLELAVAAMQVIQTLYRPQGYNLGINLGESAGAGILDHVHMHVVPRWSGDTNFMSTLGSTRVLPETLEDTYIKMKKGWR